MSLSRLLARTAWALATVLFVVVLNFVLFRVLPGDPVRAGVRDPRLTSEVQEALRSVSRELMRNHLKHCAAGAIQAGPEEAEAMMAQERPDLIIMDVRLPDGSGIEACREIRSEFPGTRVIMLTSYPDEEAVLSAIIAGASDTSGPASADFTWASPEKSVFLSTSPMSGSAMRCPVPSST